MSDVKIDIPTGGTEGGFAPQGAEDFKAPVESPIPAEPANSEVHDSATLTEEPTINPKDKEDSSPDPIPTIPKVDETTKGSEVEPTIERSINLEDRLKALDLASQRLIAHIIDSFKANPESTQLANVKNSVEDLLNRLLLYRDKTSFDYSSLNNGKGLSALIFDSPLRVRAADGKNLYVVSVLKFNPDGTIQLGTRPDHYVNEGKTYYPEETISREYSATRDELMEAVLIAGKDVLLKNLPPHQKVVLEEHIKRLEGIKKEEKEDIQSEEFIDSVEKVLEELGIVPAGRLIAAGIKNPELIKDTIIIENPQILIEIFGATPENQLVLSEMASKRAENKREEARQTINTTKKEELLKEAEEFEAVAHAHDVTSEELKKPDNKIGQKLKSAFDGSDPTLSETIITILEHNIKDGTTKVMNEIITKLFPKEAEEIKGFLSKHGKTIGKFSLLAALGLMYALMKSGKEQPQGYQ